MPLLSTELGREIMAEDVPCSVGSPVGSLRTFITVRFKPCLIIESDEKEISDATSDPLVTTFLKKIDELVICDTEVKAT